MWVLTNTGVLSTTTRPSDAVADGDDRVLQVRARRLTELKEARRLIGDTRRKIHELPGSDYEYRLYVTRAEWVTILTELSARIDYVKFKSTVRDPKLHDLYVRVWAAIAYALSSERKLQELGLRSRRG